jgi:fido (protein-threonine AMPylation protein)
MTTDIKLINILENNELIFEDFSFEPFSKCDECIEDAFLYYMEKKKNHDLYSKDNYIPQNIIKLYYKNVDKPSFDLLMQNFKRRYVYNESLIEGAHDLSEKRGMAHMYDYINEDLKPESISIFTLNLLHHRLFSKVPFPEASKGFRTEMAYISGADFTIERPENIMKKINSELLPESLELVKKSVMISQEENPDLINYINEVVAFGCKIIKIHPFFDGNGRSTRCFMNILFKFANIPPVYIKNKERDEYLQAMSRALSNKDFESINKFYYYKICDSLYELDISQRIQEKNTHQR